MWPTPYLVSDGATKTSIAAPGCQGNHGKIHLRRLLCSNDPVELLNSREPSHRVVTSEHWKVQFAAYEDAESPMPPPVVPFSNTRFPTVPQCVPISNPTWYFHPKHPEAPSLLSQLAIPAFFNHCRSDQFDRNEGLQSGSRSILKNNVVFLGVTSAEAE